MGEKPVKRDDPIVEPESASPRSEAKKTLAGFSWERRWVIFSVFLMSVVLFAISYVWGQYEQAVVAWVSTWWGGIIGYYFAVTSK